MKVLLIFGALLGSGLATSVPVCADRSACVHKDICLNGYVDTSGAGALNLRSYPPNPPCYEADHVCCEIPGTPREPDDVYYQCHIDEECVVDTHCHSGVINTDGTGLIDLRGSFNVQRKCGEKQVCCRHPDSPKPVDYCPDSTTCKEYDYCTYEGHTVTELLNGQVHEGTTCNLFPGEVGSAVGVCCGPAKVVVEGCAIDEECVPDGFCIADDGGAGSYGGAAVPPPAKNCYLNIGNNEIGTCCKKTIDPCPLEQQCLAHAFCDAEGHVSPVEIPAGFRYSGQDCYIGFSLNIGVCCKQPRAPVIEPCVPNERCMPKGFCDASGHVSTTELVDVSLHYQGQDCYVDGLDGVIGTCCKPPKPQPCPQEKICTPHNYCGADGHLTPTAHTGPSYAGQACPIGVDSGTVGVCCGPAVPKLCNDGNECSPAEYCDIDGYVVSKPTSNPYVNGQECSLLGGYGGYGICCNPNPPIDLYCPKEAECVPQEFCFGSILEQGTTDVWGHHETQKSWQQCSLPGGQSGVCCKTTIDVDRKCGKSYYASQKVDTRFYEPVLDKLEADFGEFPWQAIVFFSNYTFKCGASLVSDKHLLTVAHCVNGVHAHDLKIRLGDWQVNAFSEPLPYQDIDVSAVYVHPEFRKDNVWNNIAILELKQKVNFEYNINTICLPREGYNPFAAGTRCIVAGWGKDSFVGTYQHILKKIDVPLVEKKHCQKLFRKTRLGPFFRLHKSYLCAGGEEGKDACVGDGGGPLVCFDDVSGTYTQVGITAWGIGCGTKDVPGAYTDVSKFTPWIDSILNNPGGHGVPTGEVYNS